MPVTQARLFEIIESWGADPQAWPAGERAAALELLQASGDVFQSALAQARAIDGLLQALPAPEPSDALTGSILLASARMRPGRVRRDVPAPGRLRPVAGLLAAAAGLLMGLTLAPAAGAAGTGADELETLVVAALGFDPGDYSLEDIP